MKHLQNGITLSNKKKLTTDIGNNLDDSQKHYVAQKKQDTKDCEFICIFHDSIPVQFSRSVVSDSLRPHESQHTRPPCLSPTPGVHSDSRPSIQWCHPAISSSVVPFSSCPQLKCCTQYASKCEKLNSGHRTEKGQFSFHPKEQQCQRMFKLLYNCTHLTC